MGGLLFWLACLAVSVLVGRFFVFLVREFLAFFAFFVLNSFGGSTEITILRSSGPLNCQDKIVAAMVDDN